MAYLWSNCLLAVHAPLDPIFPDPYFPGTFIGREYTSYSGVLSSVKANNINVYGWLNPSYNLSSAANSNVPISFQYLPNRLLLDQAVLVFEKTPDTLQTNHMDYGFNFSNLFGTDYRYTTMAGLLSQQYIEHNNKYGYDPVIANIQLFVPGIGQGTLVTLGRFLSPADIETPLSTGNYLVTHSLSFTYSAYTQMGLFVNTKLNHRWSYSIGMHASSDIAIWSVSAAPAFTGYVQWTADDEQDSIFTGIAAINNGQYRNQHNNLQQMNLIWTHQFSEEVFVQTEAMYEFQKNALQGGTCVFGNGGSGCGRLIPGYSAALGLQSVLQKKWKDDLFSSIRANYFNDFQGQHTNYQTAYMSFSIGLTEIFRNSLKIRPEFRYDLGLSGTPYDNGTRSSVVLGLLDVILLL
jgi:hypothetical protein